MWRIVQSVSKAPTELVVEVALTLALLVLAYSGLSGLPKDWTALGHWRAERIAGDELSPRAPLSSIGGVSAAGAAILIVPPRGISRYVLFVVRGASLQKDLAFWAAVRSLLPASAGVEVVGYCDGPACVRELERGAQPPGLAVISYTNYITARIVLRAGAEGDALVLNGNLAGIGSVPWQDVSSPASVTAAIGKLK